MKEFKGEYYNSLSLEGKIAFAVKTMDKEKIIEDFLSILINQ